ncbi:IS4 family transposase [Pseudoduganella sp. HUAS MS19]
MHAHAIIQGLLDQECPNMHAKRRTCLAKVATAALHGGLSLVRMGKKLASATQLRHRIKCCDRLLSNPHLAQEKHAVYRALARRVIRQPGVQIAVDWSAVRDDSSIQLLRAAAIVKGRAFTLYEETHPCAKLGSPIVHQHFLQSLRSILPPGSRAIIITDAGFRASWFKLLNQLGFAWVGRIRNRDMVRWHDSPGWVGCKTLYAQASAHARDLGQYFYTRANPVLCRLVLLKRHPKGRRRLTKIGKPARSCHSKKNSRGQREPWLLAVSPKLASLNAEQIANIYAGRMQIEQTFRDLKNAQWGMGLRLSQTHTLRRLAILLLLGTLLTYALWLIGLAARKTGFSVAYGSRAKAASTLSILSLAMHWINEAQPPSIHLTDIKHALIELISMVRVCKI